MASMVSMASLVNIWRFVAAAHHDALVVVDVVAVVVASTNAQLLDKHAKIAQPAGLDSLDAQPGLAGINPGRMSGVLFVQLC